MTATISFRFTVKVVVFVLRSNERVQLFSVKVVVFVLRCNERVQLFSGYQARIHWSWIGRLRKRGKVSDINYINVFLIIDFGYCGLNVF
ncbi:hypothetical protein QE152_g38279 [Popillia japonica]|uniref:Secreted protein n=1 Tax=Popillia japonica TaxID=7064 RepID=A0AAW1I6X8_POPJA